MSYNYFMILRYKKIMEPVKCIATYISMIIPLLIFIIISRPYSSSFFQAGLLFTGWFTWTFTEYMLHRFGHHEQGREKLNASQQLHQYHHTHPTEIKITVVQRLLFIGISSGSLWLSFWLNNYFSLISGFVCGITMFFLMHYILHQKWSVRIFPRLHRYHIYHHCKYPNRCHGITVPWWDLIFGTVPPKEIALNEKVLTFYYKAE
ncbi:MAG: hypothetical protein EPN92_10575 [Chitinophagaceae bacterium]|nr:MAG: hypothetical protein EPN92_10575 [Chitinophagaceae bacterium]